MNSVFFDHIFRRKNIVKFQQHLTLFTTEGRLVKGRYLSCFVDSNNLSAPAELIKLDLGIDGVGFFKPEEILTLKITFENEFVNHKCEYSLLEIPAYLELLQTVEIKLVNNSILKGNILSYPNSAGLYGMDIDLVTDQGESYQISFDDINAFSLIFEQCPYLDEILSVQ